jgi:hypothetical protein
MAAMPSATASPVNTPSTDAASQIKANAYLIGDSLQLFNNFDGDVTFPAGIGDQFRQWERRKIVGGAASYTRFGALFG